MFVESVIIMHQNPLEPCEYEQTMHNLSFVMVQLPHSHQKQNVVLGPKIDVYLQMSVRELVVK